jgi:hypothetical protein
MKHLAFLAVVACLCGGALPVAGRAGTTTYEIFNGGTGGTLLLEARVQQFIGIGTDLGNFTPTFLTSGLTSPGFLEGAETFRAGGSTSLADIQFTDGPGGIIQAILDTMQFPTTFGTFSLNPKSLALADDSSLLPAPDTLVIESLSTAVPEPSLLALAGTAALAGLRLRTFSTGPSALRVGTCVCPERCSSPTPRVM